MVRIKNISESEIYVECEDGIAYEISEKFTFMVPGAQFSPKYRSKMWDGKIRLFHSRTRVLPRGLSKELCEFLTHMGYEYSYDNVDTEKYTKDDVLKAIDDLGIPEKYNTRDYQLDSILESLNEKRQIVISPTGSGKSLLIYIHTRLTKTKKNIIIVPTVNLVNQLYSDFQDYGFDSEKYVHRVFEGKNPNSDKPITISTWQSLFNLKESYFEQYDSVVGDEAHLFKAKSTTYVLKSLSKARYRLGTTGTLDGTKTHLMVLKGLFGEVYTATTTRELIDRGLLADLKINCVLLQHLDSNKKFLVKNKKTRFPDEIAYLIGSDARNDFISKLALSLQGNTIIFYQYVEKHGEVLYNKIKSMVEGTGRKVYYIHGGIKGTERESIRKEIMNDKDSIIVASFGTSSTGMNIPNLDNAIFASPSKARVKNLQSIGRILRTTETKDKAKLFDIADDLRFGISHLEERMKTYAEEKLAFKLMKFKLKG